VGAGALAGLKLALVLMLQKPQHHSEKSSGLITIDLAQQAD
jgi:hypothetical protein